MLKIASALNGFSVRQSVTTLGIELQLQLNLFFFNKKILFFNKKKWIFFCLFFEKNCFLVDFFGIIFRVRQPMEDNLIFFIIFQKTKKKFGKKWEKQIFGWNLFWSSSAEDDLWKTTWLIISLPCTALMLVLPHCNFYFHLYKLQLLNLTMPQNWMHQQEQQTVTKLFIELARFAAS